ncbi:hypothetical protein REPUB_Repub08aG0100400 [Reevesia pubescens]
MEGSKQLLLANAARWFQLHQWQKLALPAKTRTRQNIPTKKQLVDPFRQGIIVEGGAGYRQTVVIRSYEVGADKTATLESLLNLLFGTRPSGVRLSRLIWSRVLSSCSA